MADSRRKKSKRSELIYLYFANSLKKFSRETSLHGLRYLADSSLSIWEKCFFFASFIAAIITVVNLIANVYAVWNSTPVIVGMNPQPTSILNVPFPAFTLCNMNQVLKSKVTNYSEDSLEFDILRYLCLSRREFNNMAKSGKISNNNLTIADFVVKHAQPCSNFLLHCKMNYIVHNCSDLFREEMTDKGLCCVFNTLHPDFLYRKQYNIRVIKNLTVDNKTRAVNWSPELGYPSELPEKFYPRPAVGTGVSMGVTIILNSQMVEYYCSSENGPGIKISVHNPIETPSLLDTGLTVPLGFETFFRIDAVHSEAVSSLRSTHRKRRQCVFGKEIPLLYYKYYTRHNCESECQAAHLYLQCSCIPFEFPRIYSNASICTVSEMTCINKATREWVVESTENSNCLMECLPNCSDLTFLSDSFSVPLSERNFGIQDHLLQNMTNSELQKNIAVVHFYYRESVFYGDIKNVYMGFTEFLSNIGGVMGLFMGFSFISVAEIIYFVILLPVAHFLLPKRFKFSIK